MRIGIDARLGGYKHAGIGRYVEQLLLGLTALPGQHTWVVFQAEPTQFPWITQSLAAKEHRLELHLAAVPHYTLSEQLWLPVLFARQNLDLLHVPHFNVPLLYFGKTVVTIHDLLWHEVNDHAATTLAPWLHSIKHRAYKLVAEQAVRHAQTVILPTQVVAKKVQKLVPQAKVQVIYDGVSVVKPAKTFATQNLHYPFLVYVGSLYPHKNVQVVLQALQTLTSLHLYICSSRGVFAEKCAEQAKQLGVLARVHFLGYVPDEDVAALEHMAVAVVQPSTSEGFGLTGVEALVQGVPLVASNIPVFHEVYGELAAYFEPTSSKDLVQVLKKVQQHHTFWVQKVRLARQDLLQRFSWSQMAIKILSVYERV